MKKRKYFIAIICALIFAVGCTKSPNNIQDENEVIEEVIEINDEKEEVAVDLEDDVEEDMDFIDGELVEKTEIVIEKEIIKTENPDYRNIKWGMTREDVLEREDSLLKIDFLEVLKGEEDISDDDEILLYETDLDGKKFDLIYYFNEEGLYGSILEYKKTEDDDYISVFNSLLEYLNKENSTEYTIEDCYFWKNRDKENSDEEIINLIQNEDLVLYKSWTNEETEEVISFFKKNDRLLLSIYASKLAQ